MSQAFVGRTGAPPARVEAAAGAQAYRGPERRSEDPLNLLGRRLNAVCVEAVDPLQIAAALEADGLDDELVASTYSMASVFELAEHLYYRVPLRLTPSASSGATGGRRWREVSHGLLFAMPGVFYPAAVSLTDPGMATLGIALSVVLGWAWSQVVVRVAYLLQGRGAAREAAAWLRASALAGITLTAAVGLVLTVSHAGAGGPALLAVGQVMYQMGAAILIMYEKEEWLFLALAPGFAAGTAFLLLPGVVGAGAAVGAISLSVALALAAAWRVTGTGATAAGPAAWAPGREPAPLLPGLGVRAGDVRDAVPFLVYGALCALLVSFDTLRHWQWIGLTGIGLTIAPLVVSMGVLEFQLRRFRERVAVLLARTRDPVDFSEGVWRMFLGALTRYALLLAVLSAALLPFLLEPGRDVSMLAGSLLANWLLGCAFFVGFALISQGRLGHVTLFLLVALGLHALGVDLPLRFGTLRFEGFTASYLLSCLLFATLLCIVAKPILCEIHNYRYDLEAARYGRRS